jgi:hypothetical protein
MIIRYKIPGVVFFRKTQRRFYRAEVVADVELTGGLDSCQRNFLHNEG